MFPLFVAGYPRSGTSAFARYLNRHPRMLVMIERYNPNMPITPDLFTLERLLDFRPGEIGGPKKENQRLLKTKTWENLAWVGDKRPGYFRAYDDILKHNPEARFIYVYRPLEEVAESFLERFQRADGWSRGLEDAVDLWNTGLRRTRRFVRDSTDTRMLIVDYGFFSDPAIWAPVLSGFLDLEFGPEIVAAWEKESAAHGTERRRKEPLTSEQAAYLQEHKRPALESWVRRHVETQFV